MVIYITSEDNKNLLNEMAEQYEWELLTEVVDKGSLNDFVADKLQVINTLQYLVIERSCVKENEQQLRDLLDTIRTMWDSQIILLEEVLQDESGEYQKVIYKEYITSLYKYQDNLVENLEYLLKGEKIPAENVYNGTWIGIMSSNSGAGATHIAMDLAQFISNAGESVCYVEANESGDLGAMAGFYGFEQMQDNHYRKDNIDYWHQMIDPEKKFAILDIGKYSVAKMEMFNQCKIKILVTDGKPYRMADALNVLRYVKDDTTRLWLNYLQEEEYEKIKEIYLNDIINPIGCITWHKGMFQGVDALYQEVLKGYLNVNIKRQSKFSFILNADSLKAKFRQPKQNKDIPEDNVDLGALENESAEPEELLVDVMKNEVAELEEAHEELPLINPLAVEIDEEEEDLDLKQEVIVMDPTKVNQKSSKSVKSILLILLLVVGVGVVGSGLLHVKDNVLEFIFNNQDAHQEATELVDEDLNINSDIKISVLEVEGADGYEVSYSTDKEFPEDRTVVVEVQTADKAVESLSAGKTYYIKVRAFKFNEDGIKVYGEYTEVQKIET